MPAAARHRLRRGRRLGVVAATAAAGFVAGLVALVSAVGSPADERTTAAEPIVAIPDDSPPAHPAEPTDRWLAVLQRLDQQRARAWRLGDRRALQDVYASGSDLIDSDGGLLSAYSRRGVMLSGVHLQFESVRVLERRPGLVRLSVVDQLADATATSAQGRVRPLPRDLPSAHQIVLVRTGAGWRIASVRGPHRVGRRSSGG